MTLDGTFIDEHHWGVTGKYVQELVRSFTSGLDHRLFVIMTLGLKVLARLWSAPSVADACTLVDRGETMVTNLEGELLPEQLTPLFETEKLHLV